MVELVIDVGTRRRVEFYQFLTHIEILNARLVANPFPRVASLKHSHEANYFLKSND